MISATALKDVLFGYRDPNKLALLVCGGRDYTDRYTFDLVMDALHRDPGIAEIIQGGARGADAMAAQYARARCIVCTTFHANWDSDGKAAGPLRNQRMLDEGQPDLVLAFPGGRGTADMVRRARKANVEVYIITGGLE